MSAGLPQAKMKDQSRQAIETKGSASENKAVEWWREITIAIPEEQGLAALGRAMAKDGHATGKNEGSKPSSH